MLTRRTSIKSAGFKSRAPSSEQRDPDRVPQPVAIAPAAPIAKDNPVRSQQYLRVVASLPCIACGIQGYSQLIDRVSAFAATELGVEFPASFAQWERMQVDPDTGEIIGGMQG